MNSNPCFYLSPDFDWKYSPVHDERGAIFSIIDSFSFEFPARFQRYGETIDNFFVSSRPLKNPRRFSYDVGRVVAG